MYQLILLLTMVTQSPADIRGTWAITAGADQIQLVLFRPNGGSTGNTISFDPSVFRGLTLAQMNSPASTATRFDIVREAGTFACEGYFQGGRGSGNYVFQPNPDFRQQMLALGLHDLDERTVLNMALLDFGPRYLNELRNAGLVESTNDRELLNLRVQRITSDYVRDMRRMYPTASVRDLVSMKVQAIFPDYAGEMHQFFPSASIRDLISMKVQAIWPDYVSEMRQMFPSASLDDIVDMKIHGMRSRR